jgi:hypothetical protein
LCQGVEMSAHLPLPGDSPAGHTTSTRLDPYVARYAARTHGMTASEIRALFRWTLSPTACTA